MLFCFLFIFPHTRAQKDERNFTFFSTHQFVTVTKCCLFKILRRTVNIINVVRLCIQRMMMTGRQEAGLRVIRVNGCKKGLRAATMNVLGRQQRSLALFINFFLLPLLPPTTTLCNLLNFIYADEDDRLWGWLQIGMECRIRAFPSDEMNSHQSPNGFCGGRKGCNCSLACKLY